MDTKQHNINRVAKLYSELTLANQTLDRVENDFVESLNAEQQMRLVKCSSAMDSAMNYLTDFFETCKAQRQDLFKETLIKKYQEQVIDQFLDETEDKDLYYWAVEDFTKIVEDFQEYVKFMW